MTLIVLRQTGLVFWRRQWHPTPALLPGKSHGWRSLVGRSPWGRQESETTERLHFHFSLSCIGEGNGNPLQCSCLENSRDGEPGGLPSMGSHRVGHDWSNLAAGLVFCRISLNFSLSDVLLMVRLDLGFWGERPQRWGAILNLWQRYSYHCDGSPLTLALITGWCSLCLVSLL